MHNQILIRFFLFFLFSACTSRYETQNNLPFVNPFIGTDANGHTHPSAQVPFGLISAGPNTGTDGWDRSSGYHYSDSSIVGFSHTHLSGTGIGDLGDILIMPMSGKIQLNMGNDSLTNPGYRSRFSHSNEIATPGYYAVALLDDNIYAEMTAARHAALHRYRFTSEKENHILLDLTYRLGWDTTTQGFIKKISDREFFGFRYSNGWAKDHRIYFYVAFSEIPQNFTLFDDFNIANTIDSLKSPKAKAVFSFPNSTKEVLVKVGISLVDVKGAQLNALTEIPLWDFELAKRKAEELWKTELNKIHIQADSSTKNTFYTALYHTMQAPVMVSDVDGKYRGMDNKIHQDSTYTAFSIYSLWDTFRAWNPLMTLIKPNFTGEMIRDFLVKYKQGGKLPVWELHANETQTMIGYHSVSIISDAYRKGIRNFDSDLALEAMIHSANWTEEHHWALDAYKKYGYVPSDVTRESVSKTLEYAYDDWTIAVFAEAISQQNTAKSFYKRAQNYRNLFNDEFNLMRGKLKNGEWVSPFDPKFAAPWSHHTDFTEGNAWQYSWSVLHDIPGLIQLMGGNDLFEKQLDALFNQSSVMTGIEVSDVTGFIGQFAQGNEPSHHVPYLYNFVNKPEKSVDLLRRICNEFYTDKPDGIIGNEDCGQMSAWYVFSMMGFYPVTPGTDRYEIGAPQLEKVTLQLENGKELKITALGTQKNKPYVKSVKINGKKIDRHFITHSELNRGGTIEFEMTN